MTEPTTKTDDLSSAPPPRRLIVNADDLGLCPAVNRGIMLAHTRGIVTSASLMVRGAAAQDAAEAAREHPRLSLGLHVDLGEWAYREGHWVCTQEVVNTKDAAAVAAEVYRQLAAYLRLVGAPPTHLDSHQHLHLFKPTHGVLIGLAAHLRVPLRHCEPGVHYRGEFYGQTLEGAPLPAAITVESLLTFIADIKPGFNELGCHPADADDAPSGYRAERATELGTLCDGRVRTALETAGIELCSFRDVADRVLPTNPEHSPRRLTTNAW